MNSIYFSVHDTDAPTTPPVVISVALRKAKDTAKSFPLLNWSMTSSSDGLLIFMYLIISYPVLRKEAEPRLHIFRFVAVNLPD